ncbi:hypothetical protein [Magnetospirillum sulfuroxidans]|uniref:Secreted (Periplasmic) protein n=1 Tax=Magnetospirillum sulfuroxidans TaxID=611300 RepID=A0ABS5IG88_9PROT|nr:hypothetical protein [Magnetospirillum sulfuroxidans]MBR9973197.1 hypothetical protein [Magnetospirillum sulfuroxidans]
MSEVLDQAAAWATILGFVIAAGSVAGIAFQASRYMAVRNADLRQREFENYHRLLHDLATGFDGKGKMVSQMAIIFELRNYPSYAQMSIKVLKKLQDDWKDSGKPELLDELVSTINFLNKRKSQ